MSAEVVVVGSINLDISIPVGHLPLPGETVLGGDALWSPGGKGANQAVAVARLGRRVSMVGATGNDPAGEDLIAGLVGDNIDVSGVDTISGVSTGVAAIAVDSNGENAIVVSPGANACLSREQIEKLVQDRHPLASASVIMAQLEVPIEALLAVVEFAPGRLVLNPAPVSDETNPGLADLVAACDVLVPNQGELARLVGDDVAVSTSELVDQARTMIDRGSKAVVVTRGQNGSLVVTPTEVASVPIVEVAVLDTTAAGDSFCGGLADALVGGQTVIAAARWTARCAAVTVTRRGAQVSLPTSQEVRSETILAN